MFYFGLSISNYPRRKHVFVRRSLMFPRRRGAPFGSQGIFLMEKLRFSTEKPRASKEQIRIYTKKAHISMEMIPIFTESRLLAMKQMQNSREKFDFYGVAMRLRRETACFYEEGVALVGHRMKNTRISAPKL